MLGRNSSAQIAKGRDWLELLYTNGDVYRHHCGGSARKTRIMFVCDPGAGNVSDLVCMLYVSVKRVGAAGAA